MNVICVAKPSNLSLRQKMKMKKKYDDEYKQLKLKFMSDSVKAAKTVTALSLVSLDLNLISSISLGALFSTMYANEYVKYVDRLNEKHQFPFHLGIPFALVLTETTINNSGLLHLNYIETFAAFFSYKYAIYSVLLDTLNNNN